jgi:hypothetical protein
VHRRGRKSLANHKLSRSAQGHGQTTDVAAPDQRVMAVDAGEHHDERTQHVPSPHDLGPPRQFLGDGASGVIPVDHHRGRNHQNADQR